MRRVVVTGLGIISSIGNNAEEVLGSLKNNKSGISFNETYKEKGFKSQVSGSITADVSSIDRKIKRFMADSSAYAYLAVLQAIEDANLSDALVSQPRTGLIAGSGGASCEMQWEANKIFEEKGVRRIGPYMVPRVMSSTVSACLATALKIKGTSYSISSACATSSHCIGNAADLIRSGSHDIMFAGGGEEEHWSQSMLFDAMGALSTQRNDTPEKASRAFDKDRDGFVISGGAGMLVLEELEHALARKAPIYAELVGFGASSDGYDMVAPSGEGAVRCMQQTIAQTQHKIDYINAHGTSTPVGDISELNAIRQVFTDYKPAISSTKSLTGHSLGAAGVHEAIYCLLMLKHQFIAASANIDSIVEEAENLDVVTEVRSNPNLKTLMSNSFGFGGTNASLIFTTI
jgi:3-oxoacyl-[acyl-carrier-protein] synthase-1